MLRAFISDLIFIEIWISMEGNAAVLGRIVPRLALRKPVCSRIGFFLSILVIHVCVHACALSPFMRYAILMSFKRKYVIKNKWITLTKAGHTYLLHIVKTGSGAHPVPYPMWTGGSYPGVSPAQRPDRLWGPPSPVFNVDRGLFPCGISCAASRPALGPTQSPIQSVSEVLFLAVRAAGAETSHLPSCIVRSRMVELYLHSSNAFAWRGT
jgi:hypothetical protein